MITQLDFDKVIRSSYDEASGTLKVSHNATPLQWFDSPQVLDCTVTAIPGIASAPLQVVATIRSEIHSVLTINSTDEYIGIYIGAAGFEQLAAIVGGSMPNLTQVYIPTGSRVSLKNMSANSVTRGSICCQFLGAV